MPFGQQPDHGRDKESELLEERAYLNVLRCETGTYRRAGLLVMVDSVPIRSKYLPRARNTGLATVAPESHRL